MLNTNFSSSWTETMNTEFFLGGTSGFRFTQRPQHLGPGRLAGPAPTTLRVGPAASTTLTVTGGGAGPGNSASFYSSELCVKRKDRLNVVDIRPRLAERTASHGRQPLPGTEAFPAPESGQQPFLLTSFCQRQIVS